MSVYEAPCLRSRRLLRDTLLKDQSLRDDCNHSTASLPAMAFASPPSTPFRGHRHSPSSSPMRPATRPDRQSSLSPTIHRRPHTATHTRDHSCSPLSNTTQPQPHLITPHEQVLRTRLEKVLFSAGVADDSSRRRERGRARSPTPAGPSASAKRNRANTESSALLPPPPSSHFLRLASSSPSSKQPSRTTSLVRQKTRTHTGRSIHSGSGSGSSGSASGKRSATGTTPPLVPDDDDHDERREPRPLLLTPPATPSPPGFGYFPAGEWGYTSQCYRNPPPDDDDEDDDDDESCSSSYSSYRAGSSISSSALHSSLVYQQPLQLRTPISPLPKIRPHSPHTPLRPFNARQASVQCRAMEGYVSFSNVEGLGVPPDEPMSPHPQEKGGKGVLTALGWGGGVVRKILGGGVEKAEGGPGGVVY